MYSFYLDNVLLPITPKQLQVKIKNQNKTVELINFGQVNILKTPENFKELSEIKGCSISISHDGDNAIASCVVEVQ